MTGNAPTKTHRQMVEEWKEEPEFKAAHDELEMEFVLLSELLVDKGGKNKNGSMGIAAHRSIYLGLSKNISPILSSSY
jgi:hypothetical protein